MPRASAGQSPPPRPPGWSTWSGMLRPRRWCGCADTASLRGRSCPVSEDVGAAARTQPACERGCGYGCADIAVP
eukprot:366223-Chlamydomonas_euryale.AAC.3